MGQQEVPIEDRAAGNVTNGCSLFQLLSVSHILFHHELVQLRLRALICSTALKAPPAQLTAAPRPSAISGLSRFLS